MTPSTTRLDFGVTPARLLLLAILLLMLATQSLQAQGLGLPGPGGCHEDVLEPNPYSRPTPLTGTDRFHLNICSSDDWFQIALHAGQVAEFELNFTHTNGDVDMRLLDVDLMDVLGDSDSAGDREHIRYVATTDEVVILRIYGYAGAANAYTFDFTLDDYSEICGAAAVLGPLIGGESLDGSVCVNRITTVEIQTQADNPIELVLTFDQALGDLDLTARDTDGLVLSRSSTRTSRERLWLDPEEDGLVFLEVHDTLGGFGSFTLSATSLVDVPPVITVDGQLRLERPVPTNRGLTGTVDLYPEGVVVELIRTADGFPIARTTTDHEGRYRLSGRGANLNGCHLRVQARLETPAYVLRILPGHADLSPHTLESEALGSYADADATGVQLDVVVPSSHPAAGAINIANTMRLGLEAFASASLPNQLTLDVVWNQGLAHPCGSCFSGGRILLAGSARDTDEFDDAIILHELAHYLVEAVSRYDNPGGDHDGQRIDPLLAYGEGIATGIALALMNSAIYIDTGQTGVRRHVDFENLPYPAAYGVVDGELDGDVSEYATAALLWDLVDDDEREPFDRVGLDVDELWRVLVHEVADERRPDMGHYGVDLADFVNALRCAHPEQSSALHQLVAFHLRFPFPALQKSKCEWAATQ